MTEKPSPTGVLGRRQSLLDAEKVQVVTNGRTYMKNKVTGEHWYSVCGIHWDFNDECDMCASGGWAHPIRG